MPSAHHHISAAALFLWSESSARNSDPLPENRLRLTVRRALGVGSLAPPDEKADQRGFGSLFTTGRANLSSALSLPLDRNPKTRRSSTAALLPLTCSPGAGSAACWVPACSASLLAGSHQEAPQRKCPTLFSFPV